MKVFLGTDHAGFEMKEVIKQHLFAQGYEVEDLGAHNYDPDDDYPDFVLPAAEAVAKAEGGAYAIVLGGSGYGEAIAANRVHGVRAIVYNCTNLELVQLGRQHNDANVLSIGARFVSEGDALEAVDVFLATEFSGDERHVRRLEKLENITK